MTAGEQATGDSPKAHYGKVAESKRLTADEMDIRRRENIAYEYLCHLEEAKVWMEACISESLPPTTEMEEGLRNGVALGKLAHFMAPDDVPLKKIYDKDLSRYQARGLTFRHTDNINHFFKGMNAVGLPSIFFPETTDIYDRKNIPRLIYCLHALSLFLFKLGKAPQIQDLYGKIKFTDEEISAMRRELEKYGIQMPAFSKIGGILANEMPVDEATLHAAVIAINDALDKQVAEDTLKQLQNPAAHLNNIQPQFADIYQNVMYVAKETKTEINRNKSLDPDSSYVPDVYDELLTHSEIQGNINKVNTHQALGDVDAALAKQDQDMLFAALTQPQLPFRDVRIDNVEVYMTALSTARYNKQNEHTNNNDEDDDGEKWLSRDEIQLLINSANVQAEQVHQKDAAIAAVNASLQNNDPKATIQALRHPALGLPSFDDFASSLYHVEMRNMKAEKQASLDYDEITSGVTVLSAIGMINQAVDAGDSRTTFACINSAEAHIVNLDPDYRDKYQQKLGAARSSKAVADPYCPLLTHAEVQQIVNEVNEEVVGENERIMAVNRINQAIDAEDPQQTLAALAHPDAKLQDVDENVGSYYQMVLATAKRNKARQSGDPTAELWYQEIQNTVKAANVQAHEAGKMSVGIYTINLAIDNESADSLLQTLLNPDVYLHSVIKDCGAQYKKRLHDYKQQKLEAALSNKREEEVTGSGWTMNRTREGYKYYFNVNTMEAGWERMDYMKKDYGLLTRDEIQRVIAEATAAYDRHLLYKANEKFVIKTQAVCRGYLARKRYAEKRSFMMDQLPAIVRIQSWWRMILAQKDFEKRRLYLLGMTNYAVRIQALVRMYLARKKFRERNAYFKKNEWAAVKIQAFVRSKWAAKDYKQLMHGENQALGVVRKFVHLLDQSEVDYAQEIEAERLRREVVSEIRLNKALEEDLNTMDIKIGLLVKNRITLQDVVSQHKTLKKYSRENNNTLPKGIKALSKQSRERLEAYQHLFYLLQTNPVYLSKLTFEMPQNTNTAFMTSVITTLYNYGQNQRDEYMLLIMLRSALEEEIQRLDKAGTSKKVEKMSDIVTGNPLVVKMIITVNRNPRGQSALKELLNPLVMAVLDNKQLVINTNPVEVYKSWLNQKESESGKSSGLDYDVTVEQALQHKEVRERINQSVEQLQKVTTMFLDAILEQLDLIPYSMRYMAKVMRDLLRAKFPTAPEKEILKIIGNLIYYRYINAAIVGPDAFGIVDVKKHKGLTNDQRRNLGSIAKILQFAASNKGFGGDSAHLSHLNPYIMEAHDRFKRYFRAACEVDDPEVHFNMDQYTDVTRVSKPVIYISLAEMTDLHKNLIEYQDAVAPDPGDPLHDILDDLGEVPDLDVLLGDVTIDETNGFSKANLAKTEISLTLSSKFEVLEDEQADQKAMMVKTKQFVVEVIRCQRRGDTLPEVLQVPCTEQEEINHQLLVRARQRNKSFRQTPSKLTRQSSLLVEMSLPLESIKQRIAHNLAELETVKLVNRQSKYQGLLNSIVQDMRNQRLYRQRRRHELVRLRATLKSLQAKRTFFEEQIDYYNQYVKTCLDNLATKGRKSRGSSSSSASSGGKTVGTLSNAPKAKGSIKYSAAVLHDKGVILEIEGLPTSQFKNVLFEIHATPVTGVFDVNAKFMGVNMDKVELNIQDLLQMQYEGVAVMQMFDKAKVNVNLLIFLLNKKFYGKKK